MKTIVQEKRGFARCGYVFRKIFILIFYYYSKLRGIQKLFTTGQIEDDFLGQIILDVKVIEWIFIRKSSIFIRYFQSLAAFNREQWFPLTGSNQHRSNSAKSRGEILLGLKVHFKLVSQKSNEQNFFSIVQIIFSMNKSNGLQRLCIPIIRLCQRLSFIC